MNEIISLNLQLHSAADKVFLYTMFLNYIYEPRFYFMLNKLLKNRGGKLLIICTQHNFKHKNL